MGSLTLHLYHDRIVGFLGRTQVVELARVHIHGGQSIRRGRSIDYRHVAESLRRKPRAFLYCQWQADLLPNDQWRRLWERLKTAFDPDSAARLITEALYIAAIQDQERQVVAYLQTQLEQATLSLAGLQRAFEPKLPADHYPRLTTEQHALSSYDQLLACAPEQSLSDPDVYPQTTEVEALPGPVAAPRPASHPRALVLRPVPLGFGTGRSVSARTKSGQPRPVRSAVAFRKVLDKL